MARDIKGLDSDMQQLVYENYNKFISATVRRGYVQMSDSTAEAQSPLFSNSASRHR